MSDRSLNIDTGKENQSESSTRTTPQKHSGNKRPHPSKHRPVDKSLHRSRYRGKGNQDTIEARKQQREKFGTAENMHKKHVPLSVTTSSIHGTNSKEKEHLPLGNYPEVRRTQKYGLTLGVPRGNISLHPDAEDRLANRGRVPYLAPVNGFKGQKEEVESSQNVNTGTTEVVNQEKHIKPTPLPGGNPEFAESYQGNIILKRFIVAAYTRLVSYKTTLSETAQTKEAGDEKKSLDEVVQALGTTLAGLNQDLENLSDGTSLRRKLLYIRHRLSKLSNTTSKVTSVDGTMTAMIDEIKELKASYGDIEKDASAFTKENSDVPDQGLNPSYEPERGRESRIFTDKWFANDKEARPGGKKSLEASLWEKSMPLNSSATYLYKLLMVQKSGDQIGFIQAIRLLSRPDVRKVETAFANHPDNTRRTTLREAIVTIYGLPQHKNKGSANRFVNLFSQLDQERAEYLFELIDNGGKASTTTRMALSLGLMERGTWSRFTTDEEEVVRLAESLDPKALQGMWEHYQNILRGNLNTFNYHRIHNFVKANTSFANIKDTAKAWKKENEKSEDDKDDKTVKKHAQKLGDWQRDTLTTNVENTKRTSKHGPGMFSQGKTVNVFLDAKDRQLAAIVNSFIVSSSKYTGRASLSLPKTTGKVKDLAKEIDAWLKTAAKEEKTYFNGYPVIRKYISGQPVKFTPQGENQNEIIIIPPKPTHYVSSISEGNLTVFGNQIKKLKKGGFFSKVAAGALGMLGGAIALVQYPLAATGNLVSLGRFNFALSRDQRQGVRAGKAGWNSGDRKFLRYMVEADTVREGDRKPDNETTRGDYEFSNRGAGNDKRTYTAEDINNKETDHIKGNQASNLKDIVRSVRHVIQTRGGEFDTEMLGTLANIARQADITLKYGAGNPGNLFTANRYKINRNQDLFKSMMKLPDRWRVQFLNAFLSKDAAIEKSKNEQEANTNTDTALDRVRRILIALRMEPKQIFEVMGSLKYGRDISTTYLQLRRYAGKETFSSHKVLRLAYELNDKELKIAKTDKEMHVGLERQFAKHLQNGVGDRKWGAKSIAKRFLSLKEHLGIHPLLNWSSNGEKIYANEYQKIEKQTSHTLSKRNRRLKPNAYNANKEPNRLPQTDYKRYHLDYVKTEKDDEHKSEVDRFQEERKNQEAGEDNLREPDNQHYQQHVAEWAKTFSNFVNNTSDFNKMLLTALEVWQAGDEFVIPNHLLRNNRNPYLSKDEAENRSNRRNIFLYEVYRHMETHHNDAAKTFKKSSRSTWRGLFTKVPRGIIINFVANLKSGNVDVIGQVLKANYRWFRPASNKDKGYGGGAFEKLSGRVLLEEWTDVEKNKSIKIAIDRRDKIKDKMRKEMAIENPNMETINDLKASYAKLDLEIRDKHIPMPRPDRLKQLRDTYTNNGSYIDMVRNLLLHLSNSTEFDKSFADALIEKGYRAQDISTLTEVYKYLAAQEKEKFLTGGMWTVQWKAFTSKSTERKEGAGRLMSAMREMDEARNKGITNKDMGENKGYFYDTYFDDVEERQESYEKQAAKYRKNLGKTLWLLSTAAFVPFGAGIGGLGVLASKLVVSAFFTGQGMAISLLNSVLDPYKHSVGGMLGEPAWAGMKGAMLSGVLLGGMELKTIFESMDWWGASIDTIEGNHVDRDASFFDRFTGSQEKRWELLGKKAGEYGARKIYKEIGKEMIRGIDKSVREGPRAGLVNFKDVFNRAFTIEMFTKVLLKISLSDGATGLAPELDSLFGAPDKDKKDYTSKDFSDDFRGTEMRRNVRRKIYELTGIKTATKILEYAISNQNPAFRPFFEKYDVKRKAPTAQSSVDDYLHRQDKQDLFIPLFEVKQRIKAFNSAKDTYFQEVDKLVGEGVMEKPEDYEAYRKYTPDIKTIEEQIAQVDPAQAKQFGETLSANTTAQINYCISILHGSHESLRKAPKISVTDTSQKDNKTSPIGPKLGMSDVTSSDYRLPQHNFSQEISKEQTSKLDSIKKKHEKSSPTKSTSSGSGSLLSWFNTNDVVRNEVAPNLPQQFTVTNVSGNGNNCLIFSIAAGTGRQLTHREAQNIRRAIGVNHSNFLENNANTVNEICAQLGLSIEIRWWQQASNTTINPAGTFTYGRGPSNRHIVNIVQVGRNHFQWLS